MAMSHSQNRRRNLTRDGQGPNSMTKRKKITALKRIKNLSKDATDEKCFEFESYLISNCYSYRYLYT